MTVKYISVSMPVSLANRIEPSLADGGYVSLSEFVKDACRRRLEEMER